MHVNFSDVVRVKEASTTGMQEIHDQLETNCQCSKNDIEKVTVLAELIMSRRRPQKVYNFR